MEGPSCSSKGRKAVAGKNGCQSLKGASHRWSELRRRASDSPVRARNDGGLKDDFSCRDAEADHKYFDPRRERQSGSRSNGITCHSGEWQRADGQDLSYSSENSNAATSCSLGALKEGEARQTSGRDTVLDEARETGDFQRFGRGRTVSQAISGEQDGDQKISVKALKRKREELISSRFGYTNDNNPFGDTTLSEPFVWKKKLQYGKAAGQDVKTTPASLLATAKAKVTEIEAVKLRREEREKEEALLEEQRELMARERERENYEDWYRKEGLFHREMALKKTDIRLEEGRCKTIDFIIKGLRIILGHRFQDSKLLDLPPYHAVYELQTISEIEDFERDVKLHTGPRALLEIDTKFSTFWESLITVARDAAERLRKNQASIACFGSDPNVPEVVKQDVEFILGGKTPEELLVLEKQVQEKLSRMDEDTDPTFWEAIQLHLPVFKARAEILRVHRQAHQAADAMVPLGSDDAPTDDPLSDLLMQDHEVDRMALREKAEAISRRVEREVNPNHDGSYSPELEPYDDDDASLATAEYHTGTYSPRLHSYDEFKSHLNLVDPLEERRQRILLRRRITEQQRKRRGLDAPKQITSARERESIEVGVLDPSSKTMSYDEFVRRERKNMVDDEEILPGSTEEQIKTHYDWEDKYRPRKPRFFNRIKTGYEWNKYNQTHYEHDNPPPKTVQGYKFNIFYPDLIDKTCTPTWKLEPSDLPDSIILRFHAGPPYEDIAFRIINREWNMDRRRGYRNTFDKGILQLYFHFKRYQYRR